MCVNRETRLRWAATSACRRHSHCRTNSALIASLCQWQLCSHANAA